MRDCIYIIRVNGRDKSAPTPTECTLRLFMHNQCLFHEHVIFTHVHQRLPTCTHCREPIYRARILRNTRCGLSSYTNIYPRTSIVICDCIYTIRCETGAMNRSPYAYGMYAAIVYAQPMFTPTCIHCRGRFIVPAYHGMYGVDNRVQPMFILEYPL